MRRLSTAALALALCGIQLVLLTTSAKAAPFQVQMRSYAFNPAVLTIPAGSSVTWTNQDQAPHNVVTTSGPQTLNGPLLQRGRSWTFTFRVAGTYAYYCSVHPDMRAQIVVTPAAAPAAPSVSTPARQQAAAVPTPPAPAASSSTPTLLPVITPTAAGAPQAGVASAAPQRSISPLLPLAGLVCAVVVFCLLLLTSPAHPYARTKGGDD